MFNASIDPIEPGRVTRYSLRCDAGTLAYSDVLQLWQTDAPFRAWFSRLLADSPFVGYRWETPPLTSATADSPFEFVLLNSPGFCSRDPDRAAYNNYFTSDDADHGVVSFTNLSGDAMLVVPSPRDDSSAYGHLAAFVRQAPEPQVDALWRVVGDAVRSRLGDRPLWLSTAGGGVAWLHVRIDSHPKYYVYAAYRT